MVRIKTFAPFSFPYVSFSWCYVWHQSYSKTSVLPQVNETPAFSAVLVPETAFPRGRKAGLYDRKRDCPPSIKITLFFFSLVKQSKRKLSGVSNFAKKKELQLKFLLLIRPRHRILRTLVREGEWGGGGALICCFFALFMETRYFEETDNSYHDFFQHS